MARDDGEVLPEDPTGDRAAPVVACALRDCGTRAPGVTMLDDQGQPRIGPPPGWGEIEVLDTQQNVLVLFVCSRACERRAAQGLGGLAHPDQS